MALSFSLSSNADSGLFFWCLIIYSRHVDKNLLPVPPLLQVAGQLPAKSQSQKSVFSTNSMTMLVSCIAIYMKFPWQRLRWKHPSPLFHLKGPCCENGRLEKQAQKLTRTISRISSSLAKTCTTGAASAC